MVCDEDNSHTKPWSAGDSTSIQPDASGDSDAPFIQGFVSRLVLLSCRQGQHSQHSLMRDSCGHGGSWLACSGASPADSGLVPWPVQPLSLTIPSLPDSLPGGVDLCHSCDLCHSYWSAGAAHYSGARTTPPCPRPYGGLLDPPSPSQFLHKWLLLVWFNVKIPDGWYVVPGSPPHWLGEGWWCSQDLGPNPA